MSIANENKLVTADELAAMPDDGRRRELVKGVLRMMSPSGGRHGDVALRLGALLFNHVRANDLGKVFATETGFIISREPDTVRAPDVAFVSTERLATLSDDDLVGFVPLAPDLVAEVISPSDVFSDVEEKTLAWLAAGVKIVLVLDPANRTVRIAEHTDQMQLLDEQAQLTIEGALRGWHVAVADLFQ